MREVVGDLVVLFIILTFNRLELELQFLLPDRLITHVKIIFHRTHIRNAASCFDLIYITSTHNYKQVTNYMKCFTLPKSYSRKHTIG